VFVAVGEMVVLADLDWAAERLTVGAGDRVLLTEDDGDSVSVWRADLVVEALAVTVIDACKDLDARAEAVREFDAVDVRDMRALTVVVGEVV